MPNNKYWFPAKRYGWGWGLPTTWQGWLAFALYLALIVAAAFRFPPHRATDAFIACVAVLSALYIALCWLKGEPTRGRRR